MFQNEVAGFDFFDVYLLSVTQSMKNFSSQMKTESNQIEPRHSLKSTTLTFSWLEIDTAAAAVDTYLSVMKV